MKKTGKAGLGHLKKTEKMSRQAASGRLRLALAATAVSKNAERKARRRCR